MSLCPGKYQRPLSPGDRYRCVSWDIAVEQQARRGGRDLRCLFSLLLGMVFIFWDSKLFLHGRVFCNGGRC